MLRDLLDELGFERATIVCQSLGGGVAMHFAYQFPERCERLVFVNSRRVGHYPHCEAPERFVEVLANFVDSTKPGFLTTATSVPKPPLAP